MGFGDPASVILKVAVPLTCSWGTGLEDLNRVVSKDGLVLWENWLFCKTKELLKIDGLLEG